MKQAAADGGFGVEGLFSADEESLLSGRISWDQFLEHAQAGIPAFVRMISCHTDEEGDPYFNQFGVFDLIYGGASYTVYYNDGEWATVGTDLYGRQYDHLLVLEETAQSGGAYTHMVLTDDGDATLEDYLALVDRGSPSGYDSEDLWRYNRLVTFYTPEAER